VRCKIICSGELSRASRKPLLVALDSVTSVAIYNYFSHCMKILDACRSFLAYGTAEFKAAVHRRVEITVNGKTDSVATGITASGCEGNV
jgi:hypothetical protein